MHIKLLNILICIHYMYAFNHSYAYARYIYLHVNAEYIQMYACDHITLLLIHVCVLTFLPHLVAVFSSNHFSDGAVQ